MNELIEKLYFMLEDYLGQYELEDEETRSLEIRRDALQSDIILRLGEDGQELMESLAGFNMELELIHNQTLFRAAMGLGAQIAQPRRSPWAAPLPNDRGTSGSG